MQKVGFYYVVSDEQFEQFARLSCLEKAQWLDEARRFALALQTPLSANRIARLRRGEPIVPLTSEN